MSDWILLSILVIVGGFDLWLVIMKRPTISHRYQAIFPTWIDLIILIGLVILICKLSISSTIKILYGVIAGHIAWPNKERYGESLLTRLKRKDEKKV